MRITNPKMLRNQSTMLRNASKSIGKIPNYFKMHPKQYKITSECYKIDIFFIVTSAENLTLKCIQNIFHSNKVDAFGLVQHIVSLTGD